MNSTDYHAKLPDEKLVLIGYFERQKTTKQARKSARDTLKARNIPKQTVDEYKREIRKRKRSERKAKLENDEYSYTLFDLIWEGLFTWVFSIF